MGTNGLFTPLIESAEFNSLTAGLKRGLAYQMVYGLSGAQNSYLIAGIIEKLNVPALIMAPNGIAAKKRLDDLRNFLPNREILYYPELEHVPFGSIAQSKELAAQRLAVLAKLVQQDNLIIVAPVEALYQQLIPRSVFEKFSLCLSVGQIISQEKMIEVFLAQGYERVEMVEGPGQFSVRGGIIDIFPQTRERPLRIELFDDEIDSIREFKVDSQRSLNRLQEAVIYPAVELVVERENFVKAADLIAADFAEHGKRLKKIGKYEAFNKLQEKTKEIIEKLRSGLYIEGMEYYFSYFYPEGASLLDYLDRKTVLFVEEPSRQKEYLQNRINEMAESHTHYLETGLALPKQGRAYFNPGDLQKSAKDFSQVGFSLLPKQPAGIRPGNIVSFAGKSIPFFMSKTDLLVEEIRNRRKKGYAIAIMASTSNRAEKIRDLLRDSKVDAFYVSRITGELKPGNVIITEGRIEAGFEIGQIKFALITDLEIYGKRKSGKKATLRHQEGALISHFTDLSVGDYVVHVNHGIGRYLGLQKLEVGGVTKDYLVIQYTGEDKLYVPTDQISLVQKYLGAEGAAPKLSRLGGQDWNKVKKRVKESVREMAQELLNLYATREKVVGHAYPPDTVWQKEFEEAFPYEETPDQLRAIKEIKEDMERPKPMDRLLCGDVGYGKTEVAIRAAFKAVMDSRQVAVLVPTTILAQQHYNTFVERFSGYPIKIEMLSRFRSPKEQQEILKNLKTGGVDIVIGTHRLVQNDVQFKKLGLVIVDEEQRFGVAHKERLKQLRKNVDVLTLTATPIPRTLHMSLVGVRDMSILETPPEDRWPVQTYVLEFNWDVIGDAVRKEMDRGGQVYFVHNRIMDIDQIAAQLRAAVPEARVAVAHGQMKEDQLEQVMLEFLEGEYDVLLCTTIIETGLDIPNVNTLIVDEADRMGLSQLYQLRGRVGRSHRLAYAYFTYRRDKVLTEVAEKRLQAIREFTEFGSGFKIAMRDLEIRGAGNFLGPEQHGHMMAVGFDMYCRLLEEAVKELKGDLIEEIQEPTIDLNIDAHIGNDYIPDAGMKIEIYQKIMRIQSAEDARDVGEELEDRYGPVPQSVTNLLAIARIKALCTRLKVQAVTQIKDMVHIKFHPSNTVQGEQLAGLAQRYRHRLVFTGTQALQINLKVKGLSREQALAKVEELLLYLLDEGKLRT
ncbi:transcription-repair coupling factor [Thermincola ferriacetica]|uniref:Transcription-repair-coupling factor n=1 Tax=Thermincola ferriacetica TaxID=281456 RepID=A0A0L6W000_9FIRM|nr:transcription-repair coupling factor [Thermincola ferriacetica]KNZ68902.1 transcription-repair coupling factor [Thermincola ferriacetica]